MNAQLNKDIFYDPHRVAARNCKPQPLLEIKVVNAQEDCTVDNWGNFHS